MKSLSKHCLITFIIILHYSYLSAATIYVPRDYSTIQQAINNVSSGDTIIVANGTYNENLTFGSTQFTLK
jgi:hypothetical protein